MLCVHRPIQGDQRPEYVRVKRACDEDDTAGAQCKFGRPKLHGNGLLLLNCTSLELQQQQQQPPILLSNRTPKRQCLFGNILLRVFSHSILPLVEYVDPIFLVYSRKFENILL